jgi:hypothetical protein
VGGGDDYKKDAITRLINDLCLAQILRFALQSPATLGATQAADAADNL